MSMLVLTIISQCIILWWLQQFAYKTMLSVMEQRTLRKLLYPGVLAHEFSHFIVALIFGIKSINFTAYSTETDELGSVEMMYNRYSLIHRIGLTFVGIAPLLIMPLTLWLLVQLFAPYIRFQPGYYQQDVIYQLEHLYQQYLILINTAPTGISTMLIIVFLLFSVSLSPSVTDYKIAKGGVMLVTVIIVLVSMAFHYTQNFHGIMGREIYGYMFKGLFVSSVFLKILISCAILTNTVFMIFPISKFIKLKVTQRK